MDRAAAILAVADGRLVAAYLYGSVARGTATATSDVDVGLLFGQPIPARLGDLRATIERNLERALRRRVQAVALGNAPADLVHRVLRDGVLLLDRDPAARIRFEVKARNAYFDLLPVLERYRRVGASTR